MYKPLRVLGIAAAFGAALTFVAPTAAQQPPPSKPAGSPTETPTKKNPLRFTAFNVSMQTGTSGVTEINIERWTTDAERKKLLGLVETAKWGEGGQRKLLDALQHIKPRVGFMRTPNSIGWDLRYAIETKMPDGTRQLVIATDKPVSFGAAASDSEAMDYPFTSSRCAWRRMKREKERCSPRAPSPPRMASSSSRTTDRSPFG